MKLLEMAQCSVFGGGRCSVDSFRSAKSSRGVCRRQESSLYHWTVHFKALYCIVPWFLKNDWKKRDKEGMEGAGIFGREEILSYSDSLNYSGEAPGSSLGDSVCLLVRSSFNKYPCEISVARSLKPIDTCLCSMSERSHHPPLSPNGVI